MSAPDRALCQELVYGVVRRRPRWIGSSTARPAPGARMSAFKMSCVWDCTRSFGWTGSRPTPPCTKPSNLPNAKDLGPKAGFVNAVLRGYLREFDATKRLLDELKEIRSCHRFPIRNGSSRDGQKRFGPERTRQLLEWNSTPPKNFARVNTLKIDAGKLLERWRAENVEYDFVRRDFLQSRPAGRDGGGDLETVIFELKSHPPLASLESFRDGWFYIQDPSTLLAPLELASTRPGKESWIYAPRPAAKPRLLPNSWAILETLSDVTSRKYG